MAVQWDYVTEVESDSEPGTWHEIKRRRTDGHLGCDCGRYRFAKKANKTCQHIEAYRSLGLTAQVLEAVGPASRAVEAVPAYATARRGAETFTFKRAITFGSIPAGGGR